MANLYAQYGTTTENLPTPVAGKKLKRKADDTGWEYSAPGDELATTSSDGSMSAADKTKLDAIESGATADQTGAEIKTAYEAEADTNAFTDALLSKLNGVEASADVTDAANVASAGAVMESDTSTALMSFVVDEDNMASDSATKVPTQQSVKAYVDNKVVSSVDYKGGYNASTNTPDLDTSPSGVLKGDMYTVTAAGAFFATTLEVGDVLIAEIDSASVEADWTVVQKNLDAASIKTAYESNADTNAFTDAEQSKLSGVESGSTADQTGAEIKTAYEAEADTNAFTDALLTKLNGIESAATADQTGAEIKTAYEGEANTNAFTDAEQSKLAGYGDSVTGTVQTTDATQTTVASHTPADNTAVTMHAVVSARKSDGSEAAGYTIMGTFRRSGATTTQVGSTTVLAQAEDDATWDCTFTTSGADVRVSVTGKAATTIDWRSRGYLVESP